MSEPVLGLDHVTFSYLAGGVGEAVLEGVNLVICPGDVLRVTGRNGSGKTTLLRALNGDLDFLTGRRMLKPGTRTVYLDQNSARMTADGLTVREHFMLAPRKYRTSLRVSRTPESVIGSLLDRFGIGLERRSDAFLNQLSGGQRQVVALLAVLQAGADVLLLDEFTSYMDSLTREVAVDLIEDAVREQGTGVVFVSHDDTRHSLEYNREFKMTTRSASPDVSSPSGIEG
jgi:ATPase subunit of ABC transporter with duplicated ATPase domains